MFPLQLKVLRGCVVVRFKFVTIPASREKRNRGVRQKLLWVYMVDVDWLVTVWARPCVSVFGLVSTILSGYSWVERSSSYGRHYWSRSLLFFTSHATDFTFRCTSRVTRGWWPDLFYSWFLPLVFIVKSLGYFSTFAAQAIIGLRCLLTQ